MSDENTKSDRDMGGFWACVTILGIIGLLVLLGALVGERSFTSNDGGGLSPCEQAWEDNAATAQSPYMTRERYINNCNTTKNDRDLIDALHQ